MKEWARMPSYWLRDEDCYPLAQMKWIGANKSDQIAALMLYIILVHHASEEVSIDYEEPGLCSLTYTKLGNISGLSRAKISGGLKILFNLGVIINIGTTKKSIYRIENYTNRGGWAKLPAKGLYNKSFETLHAFHKFKLRSKNELNAMKIYLIIISLRNNSTNYAQIGYEKICEYTGIYRNEIKSATSLLINLGLLQVDIGNSEINQYSVTNMYRLCYLEPYKHRGTSGRDYVNATN